MFPNLNFPDGFTFSLIGQVDKEKLIEPALAEHLGRQLGYVISDGSPCTPLIAKKGLCMKIA